MINYSLLIKFIQETYKKSYSNYNFYSTNVATWLNWYSGYVKEVHQMTCYNGQNFFQRDRYRLRMAKRVCEDWASSVMNEDIAIVVNASNQKSSVFVQGNKGNKGVLGSNNFRVVLSEAIEQMFALGTSALVLELDNVGVDEAGYIRGINKDSKIIIQKYNATQILPVSYRNGVVTECAFVSEYMYDNKTYHLVSVHLKEADGYVIYTSVLDDMYKNASLKTNFLPILRTGSQNPLFYILKTNIANNIDLNSPLGISVYSEAIDNLAGCDLTYDCCLHEVVTGKRIIGLHKSLISRDNEGNLVMPQGVQENSYFQFFGDENTSQIEEFIKEFHSTLNTVQLDAELTNQLKLLGAKVGLGSQYYRFDVSTGGVTATEYIGERNDFIRNAGKMTLAIESTIEKLVSGILYLGKYILRVNVDDNAKVTVTASDGVVESDEKKREMDRQDVKEGLMSKVEYRMKWYNETEEAAIKSLAKIEGKPLDNT